jgi:hypothetical protein
MLITTEEWAALLGIEPVLAVKDTSDGHENLPDFSNIHMVATESAPTRSLRDVISNEEISALLSDFPAECKELTPAKLRKRKAPINSRTKPSCKRPVHAKS